MRYVLAGAVALTGLVLVGLAYHDTVSEAWAMLKAPASSKAG